MATQRPGGTSSDDPTSDGDADLDATTDPTTAQSVIDTYDGYPGHVQRTEGNGDGGLIRLAFPDAGIPADDDELARLSWEEFRSEFEEKDLALVYPEGQPAGGEDAVRLVERQNLG